MEVEAERHGRPILRVSCNHAARAGVPVHQHPLQEAFFILEGQAEFALENGAGLAWKEVNPGDMVNIPPDAIHGFRNESDRDVKLLLTCEAGLGSYASMGTLQNRLQKIFETIAKACAELDAQLVLSLGSRDQSPGAAFAAAPIVVSFAPQIELLKRTTLTITHAGLNTALESLSQGVPMVAIPVTNDQPGVASRLEWLGVAEVAAPSRLSAKRLEAAIRRVLREPAYRENALRCQQEIAQLNGLTLAADIVDQAISAREPVLCNRRHRVRAPPNPIF